MRAPPMSLDETACFAGDYACYESELGLVSDRLA